MLDTALVGIRIQCGCSIQWSEDSSQAKKTFCNGFTSLLRWRAGRPVGFFVTFSKLGEMQNLGRFRSLLQWIVFRAKKVRMALKNFSSFYVCVFYCRLRMYQRFQKDKQNIFRNVINCINQVLSLAGRATSLSLVKGANLPRNRFF